MFINKQNSWPIEYIKETLTDNSNPSTADKIRPIILPACSYTSSSIITKATEAQCDTRTNGDKDQVAIG